MANKVSFIIQLKDKFGPISDKVNKKFLIMERNARRTNRELEKQEKKFKGLRQQSKRVAAQGLVATAAITAPILLISKSMIDAASDATETANKFNAVFDDVEGKANKVANSFSKNFGTAGSTSRKLIGDTGDLLVGFGFTGDAALEMSGKVNELAADLTSFQNVEGGVSRASAALTKALLGETESAKSLGIVIRQDTKEFRDQVGAIARSQRITKQQAKAIVILNQAMKQSKKAIGDVKRTWFDHASEVRRNEEAVKQMKETFGVLLIPIATKVTRVMTKLAVFLEKLSPAWKTSILATAGFLAVGGPLLILLGGIAFAVTAISAPVLLVGAAVLGLGAIITAVALNWDNLVNSMLSGVSTLLVKLAGFASKIGLDSLSEDLTAAARGMKEASGGEFITTTRNGSSAESAALAALRLDSVGGRSSESIASLLNAPPVNPPGAPTGRGVDGTLSGMITVAAEKGARITRTAMKTTGSGLNLGMNVPLGSN